MFQFGQQILAKIISIIAGLIVTLGIVQMPQVTYEASQYKTFQKEIIREITPPKTLENKTKSAPASQVKPTPTTAAPITQPEQPSAPASPSGGPAISLTELNTKVRKTIVNILCTTKIGGSFKPITGSGVIVSPKGVILTNAHIGQYFLLEGEPSAGYLECIIRSGDIASPSYDAKLVYIPSIWIEENAANIIQQEPKGTGENDYAFLLITKSIVQGKELPQIFDFSEPNLDFNILPFNFSALLASYPAGFIGGIEVQKNLGLTSTFANVNGLYTFVETGPSTLDLFSLGGNIVAQSGSSGGGVFDTRDGKLIGIIVTSTEGTTTAAKTLNAITMPHVKRSFETLISKNIAWFLEDPETFNVLPASEFTRLKNLLIEQLKK